MFPFWNKTFRHIAIRGLFFFLLLLILGAPTLVSYFWDWAVNYYWLLLIWRKRNYLYVQLCLTHWGGNKRPNSIDKCYDKVPDNETHSAIKQRHHLRLIKHLLWEIMTRFLSQITNIVAYLDYRRTYKTHPSNFSGSQLGMLKIAITVFSFCSQILCFDKGISFYTYKDCQREVIVAGDGTDTGYLRFQNFLPIENLTYNGASDGEILSLRFFFQGRSDFSVLFSAKNKQPTANEKVFQTGKSSSESCSTILQTVSLKSSNRVWTTRRAELSNFPEQHREYKEDHQVWFCGKCYEPNGCFLLPASGCDCEQEL